MTQFENTPQDLFCINNLFNRDNHENIGNNDYQIIINQQDFENAFNLQ